MAAEGAQLQNGAEADQEAEEKIALALVQQTEIQVLKELGIGGNGIVHKVFSSKFGTGAFKRPLPRDDKDRQFQINEAVLQLKFCFHINILLFNAFVMDKDTAIGFLSEYMPGGSVFDMIKQKVNYKEEHFLNWIVQACRGMAFCHENNVIHRDLKTANLLLSACGTRLKVADFGWAKKNSTNEQTANPGSWIFMAPELMSEDSDERRNRPKENHTMPPRRFYDARCDVYSMAVTLWSMAAKLHPFAEFKNPMNLTTGIKCGLRPYMSADAGVAFFAEIDKLNPKPKINCALPNLNGIEHDVMDIIVRHWSEVTSRPKMAEMRDELDKLCKQRSILNPRLAVGNEHMLKLDIVRSDEREPLAMN